MVALTDSITIEAPPMFPYLESIGLAFGDLVLGDTCEIAWQIERIADNAGADKAGDRKNSEVNKTELLKPCCRISFLWAILCFHCNDFSKLWNGSVWIIKNGWSQQHIQIHNSNSVC
jgi:hypothetical protein